MMGCWGDRDRWKWHCITPALEQGWGKEVMGRSLTERPQPKTLEKSSSSKEISGLIQDKARPGVQTYKIPYSIFGMSSKKDLRLQD